MAQDLKRRTRSGGRAGSVARRGSAVIEQMPWNPPINIDRPTEPLNEAGVLAVHDGAMRILEEIGITFLNPEAVEILRASGGCTIEGENVRMGRDFVMEMIAKAPRAMDDHPAQSRSHPDDRRAASQLWQRVVAAKLLGHENRAQGDRHP